MSDTSDSELMEAAAQWEKTIQGMLTVELINAKIFNTFYIDKIVQLAKEKICRIL